MDIHEYVHMSTINHKVLFGDFFFVFMDGPVTCHETWGYITSIVFCMLWVRGLTFFFNKENHFSCHHLIKHPYSCTDFWCRQNVYLGFYFCISLVESCIPSPVLSYLKSPYLDSTRVSWLYSSLYILRSVCQSCWDFYWNVLKLICGELII